MNFFDSMVNRIYPSELQLNKTNVPDTLLLQGLSEYEFYADFVYKFRKITGKNDFINYFKKIIVR